MNHNLLAVDLGASSGRVLHGAWDGARLTLRELHRFPNGPVRVSGTLRWDVLRLWSEICAGIGRYGAAASGPLHGIGVDTWGVDYALLDRAGQLLGNPYCYRDQRTSGVEPALFAAVPREQIFATTGIQFTPINTIYQLFAQRDDPGLRLAEHLLLMPDLFHYWLSGAISNEFTQASTTQLVDARTQQWATGLVAQLGLPERLFARQLTAPGSVIGELRPDLLAELRLAGPVPVIAPGSHDTASAVVAVPHLDASSAYISSGTWSLVGVEVDAPVLTPAALALNVTNEGGVAGTTRLLKNVMGLWLLQECRAQWQREGQEQSWDTLLLAAERAAPLQSLFDPDAAELLHPGDMPARIRARCQRTGEPVPADAGALVRACLESLALRYRWVVEGLERLTGRQISTVRVVGGGCQNRLLCQLTADACGRPVVAGPVEGTALGNMLVQLIALGALPDLGAARSALARSVELVTFAPRAHADWDAAYARFCALLNRG